MGHLVTTTCTTKMGPGEMNQILIPLPQMLNSMKGKKPVEHCPESNLKVKRTTDVR